CVCRAPWQSAEDVAPQGIPVRIGLERRRNHRWLTDALPAENRVKPVVEEVLRLLTPLGIRDVPSRYQLHASRLTNEPATVTSSLGGDHYVVLHPFAGSEDRCVPLDKWMSVADELSSTGMSILWGGGRREPERVRD